MKRVLAILFLLFPFLSCCQPKTFLTDRTLELCQYIPDHVLKPEAKEAMTPDFFRALSEAFNAPVADYGEIGDNEWLWYFVTGNGGSEPVYSVKAACQAYVRQVREKYASGEYVKYLESAEDLKEYVPDFQERVKDFYEKYGE